ncbi:MAG: NfeD family protein [Planctomycetota bacterium]|nr:NfeD family protein [Planctomycetota bacterium]
MSFLLCLVISAVELRAQEDPPAGDAKAPAANNAAEKPQKDAPRDSEKPKVIIEFDGPIGPMLEQYVYRKLDEAKRLGADVVIIQIDSPGGLVDASFNIAKRLHKTEWARTIAFIPEQAISGAAFVALGCDEILMAPNASLGDAGPIFMDEGFQFRHAPEKIRSNLAERIRTLADETGRPAALAEAMVDMNLTVFRVKNLTTGKEAFMTDEEIKSSNDPAQWKKIKPVLESRDDTFLQVNGTRAVELGLADGLASTRKDVARRLGFKGRFIELRFSFFDRLIYILNHPVVTGLLFVVGLVGLYIEFSSPGIGIGGLLGALCFGIFFWSHYLGGTAGWLELVLFAAGVAFVLVELFVLPGFGVAGLSGLVLILTSLVMACQTTFIPRSPQQWATLSVTLQTLFVAGVIFLLIAFFLNSRLRMIPILNRIMLPPPGPDGRIASERVAQDTDSQSETLPAAAAISIGDRGIALSLLRPAGKADFGGHRMDVVTDGDFINKNDKVEVVEISGNRIVVIPVK